MLFEHNNFVREQLGFKRLKSLHFIYIERITALDV
jgi:hypothetical protein